MTMTTLTQMMPKATIICFSGNRACQFPPARQFFNNDHATVCSPSMYIYLRSQCLMSTFVVSRLFRSVSGCPYGKEGLVGDEICNSPWLVNQLATVERVRTTGRKQCWFCLFWRLTTTFFWMCFGVFRTISHGFQARYLANWWPFRTTV